MNGFETFIVWVAIFFLWFEFFYIAHLEEKIKKLKENIEELEKKNIKKFGGVKIISYLCTIKQI